MTGLLLSSTLLAGVFIHASMTVPTITRAYIPQSLSILYSPVPPGTYVPYIPSVSDDTTGDQGLSRGKARKIYLPRVLTGHMVP